MNGQTLATMRKFLAAVVGVGTQIVAANVLTGSALHYVQLALGIAAAVGVYLIPNATIAPAPPVVPPAVPPVVPPTT